MGRLVVVSNRVALPGESRAGGLAVALQAALEDRARQRHGGLWFGWSGKIDPTRSGRLHEQQVDGITYATIDLSRRDHAFGERLRRGIRGGCGHVSRLRLSRTMRRRSALGR